MIPAIIKNRRDFLAANAGKKTVTPALVLQMKKRPADHPVEGVTRIGFTVTKKMGNAIARNRIKRRLREAVRKADLPLLPQCDYVIISRQKALDCPFADLLSELQFAFSKIGK